MYDSAKLGCHTDDVVEFLGPAFGAGKEGEHF
jgi:hypothetical protein